MLIDNPYRSPQTTDRPPSIGRMRPLPAPFRWAHRFSTVVLALGLTAGIIYGSSQAPLPSTGFQLLIAAVAFIAALLVIGWHFWPGRFGYAVCLLAAMVLTPSDPISFLVMALPLCLLFFLATRILTAYRRAT